MNARALSDASHPIALPADCAPKIARLYTYWHGIRPAPGLLPGRQHLMPKDIRPLLRNLWLVDVVGDPVRFRYRVLGTAIDQLIGTHLNGAWLDEVHGEFVRSGSHDEYAGLVRGEAEFLYSKGPPLFSVNKDFLWLERICVPLAEDGHSVDTILGLTLYGPPRPDDRR